MQQKQEDQEVEKRDMEDRRKMAEEQLNQEGDDASKIVIMATYKQHPKYRVKIEDLANAPPGDLFMPLGFEQDETKPHKRKHYRQYYPCELEKVKEIFPKSSPFNKFDLKRGQSRGLAKTGIMSWFRSKR